MNRQELMIGKNKKQIKRINNLYDHRLLYEMQSPRTNDGRGVVFGKIFTKDGKLAVTTAQEGVVRLTKKEQEKRRNKDRQAKLQNPYLFTYKKNIELFKTINT